jgi:branched-chain amino acid transport system ATP-binding protein
MRLLEVEELDAYYGDFQALASVNIHVAEGELVAIIGPNGAGKSTLLRCIAGLVAAAADAIRFDGRPIGGMAPHTAARLGIAMVPEGRRLFPSLTVEENLLMGRGSERTGTWNLDRVYGLFPVLAERRHAPSTALSGGQQQMVAIGRALMANPRLLLCDELSLGLAPAVVGTIYATLPAIRADRAGLIVVEQDVARALVIADRVYCLSHGRVDLLGDKHTLTRDRITASYFGAAS